MVIHGLKTGMQEERGPYPSVKTFLSYRNRICVPVRLASFLGRAVCESSVKGCPCP